MRNSSPPAPRNALSARRQNPFPAGAGQHIGADIHGNRPLGIFPNGDVGHTQGRGLFLQVAAVCDNDVRILPQKQGLGTFEGLCTAWEPE
jgi:hypothetical protein